MGTPIQAVPPKAQPWARGVEDRLGKAERQLGIVSDNLSSIPELDKTVFSEYALGQNMGVGVSGRVEVQSPVAVQFVSSTGLFEVTVSISGLVRDGAIFGGSFESAEVVWEAQYDIPKYGVVSSAPIGQTQWFPFAASSSTIINTRPGVQNLNLYLYAVCTAGANSAAYLKRARLAVKAV